ncbi:right-handed parallel beta-helix repeat-containing protein [Pseudonocardia nigra]|uniref:right-handed parallel beta-helix repeat-containing protein n=1 Tax=Pseudonocardia nigra TaxID=1921578 RepID=UPI001C5F3CC1|nr:right-handed parallel beta-helix repeat-containing protein [Pseudonocardia nigra]
MNPVRHGRRRVGGSGACLLAAVLVALASCSSGVQEPAPPPAGSPAQPVGATVCAHEPTVEVSDGYQLVEALAGAEPGTVIGMAPGTYSGNFVATAQGTAERPIALCGTRDAVLDGGEVDGDYALHLDGATHWQLIGFTVSGGQKGVMVDRGSGILIEGLLVEGTGDEAVHLRQHSSDNVVRGNTIRRTGLRKEKFGEGIYIGSAESNWCDQTNCEPDRSDRNVIEGNTISETTSESVDIKEGTTGGVLRNNRFSGAGMTGADSWVDVKGNNWTIVGNVGVDAPEDGFQVHEILDGWGLHNTFADNTATVNADGYAINITKNRERNEVACSNTVSGAGKGLSTVDCR